MLSAIFTFLGGAAFRYLVQRGMDWLERKQAFREEQARLAQQEQFDQSRHLRQKELIELQHNLKVGEIKLVGETQINLEDAKAFTVAQERAHQPTGNKIIDAWNGGIRPAAATMALLMWAGKILKAGFAITQWDMDLATSILGFYFADRHLGKRGK
jgi:hypothetical protein